MSRSIKITVFFTIFNLVCACWAVSAVAELKLAYIRSDYIFSKYEPYKAAQKQLEEFQKKEFDQLQKMKDEIDEKSKEALQQQLLMSDEMKQRKFEELQKQQEELQKQYEKITNPESGTMIKKQAELMQPIINRINEVLMRIAKNEAYDFIFDATVGSNGTVLFANEKFDISENILEELQKDISSQ